MDKCTLWPDAKLVSQQAPIEGVGFTLMVTVALVEQYLLEMVTVYVVVIVGLAMGLAIVSELSPRGGNHK